ncbi:MAG: ComF family protein, partial [Desulfovermiculus sp.]
MTQPLIARMKRDISLPDYLVVTFREHKRMARAIRKRPSQGGPRERRRVPHLCIAILGNAWRRMIETRRCLVCARPVLKTQCADGLCPECDLELQPRKGGFCPRCGQLYAQSEAEPYLCAKCRRQDPGWDGFGFLGSYSGMLRDLILDFKFHACFERRNILRSLLLRAHAFHFQGLCSDGIIPVPLHVGRLRERGFNQSLEIARGLSRELSVPLLPSALVRIRPTKAQSGLERKERLKNVRGAFQADQECIWGKHVLLVDDVSTTGATLSACARTLRRAGAVQVDA